MKRISFGEHDATMLYEFYLAHLQGAEVKECADICYQIGKRLKKFIGKKEGTRIKKMVKKYPYFKKHD